MKGESMIEYWFQRGRKDAEKERPVLFSARRSGVIANGDVPDDWTEQEIQERGKAYLRGFDAGSR